MPTDSAKTLDSLLTAEIIGASSPQHMSHNANSITRFSWDNRATRSTERGAKKPDWSNRCLSSLIFFFFQVFFFQCFALDIPAFVWIRLSFHQWSPAGGAPGGLAEFLHLISFLMWTDLGIRDFGGVQTQCYLCGAGREEGVYPRQQVPANQYQEGNNTSNNTI